MYLKHKLSGNLVEILDVKALADPCSSIVSGRFHAGEEIQDVETYAKTDLIFPSGEELPVCWRDAEYKKAQ